MASGMDCSWVPSSQDTYFPLIPLRVEMTFLMSPPCWRYKLISLPRASASAFSSPPDLPRVTKTSFSSPFTMLAVR